MMLDEVASSMSSLNSWKSMVNPPCSCRSRLSFRNLCEKGIIHTRRRWTEGLMTKRV